MCLPWIFYQQFVAKKNSDTPNPAEKTKPVTCTRALSCRRPNHYPRTRAFSRGTHRPIGRGAVGQRAATLRRADRAFGCRQNAARPNLRTRNRRRRRTSRMRRSGAARVVRPLAAAGLRQPVEARPLRENGIPPLSDEGRRRYCQPVHRGAGRNEPVAARTVHGAAVVHDGDGRRHPAARRRKRT